MIAPPLPDASQASSSSRCHCFRHSRHTNNHDHSRANYQIRRSRDALPALKRHSRYEGHTYSRIAREKEHENSTIMCASTLRSVRVPSAAPPSCLVDASVEITQPTSHITRQSPLTAVARV